jgi:hypothetical protein
VSVLAAHCHGVRLPMYVTQGMLTDGMLILVTKHQSSYVSSSHR